MSTWPIIFTGKMITLLYMVVVEGDPLPLRPSMCFMSLALRIPRSYIFMSAFRFPSSSPSVSCAVCDCRCRRIDCKLVPAEELPSPLLLEAGDHLKAHDYIIRETTNYHGDTTKCLDKLVLAKEGFESDTPHRLRVCDDCHHDLRRGRMPFAALANGLWLGDFPEHLRDSTWVEMAAASPVRTSGMVFALEQLKVGGIPGSAHRMMRGTFTFFFQNAYSVENALPSCDTDIAGSMTCALVGARPTDAPLKTAFRSTAEQDIRAT